MSRVGETAELIIGLGGNVRMIYSELIEPHALGDPTYAAKIGADSLFLYGKDKPILACGLRTQYVWMPLLNQDLSVDLAQTQCVRTSTVAPSSRRRRAS